MLDIQHHEILNSFNYAINCDKIYAGFFTEEQVPKLQIENTDLQKHNDTYVIVRNKKFELDENDSIFCSLEFIDELFYLLSKANNLRNIKLLTHQSDKTITKKLFLSKPDCISLWLGINVDYEDKNLIPIPIGLSNEHPKNVNYSDIKLKNKTEKEKLIYVNFNENTNIKHRKNLYNNFKKYKWATVDNANLTKQQYINNLNQHKFNLSPWGNGIDTHRFWESIYLGTIPITQKHITYNSARGLPHLAVEDYSVVSFDFLRQNIAKEEFNFENEKLRVSYWINYFNSALDTEEQFNINSKLFYVDFLKLKKRLNNYYLSKFKIIKYYLHKVMEKIGSL